jgi:hypothetical protein
MVPLTGGALAACGQQHCKIHLTTNVKTGLWCDKVHGPSSQEGQLLVLPDGKAKVG